jgi:hypothetical protein
VVDVWIIGIQNPPNACGSAASTYQDMWDITSPESTG